MITTQRATEIARSIVAARIAINGHGEAALIDNNLMGGIELAHMVTSGYVGQLTSSGERRLMDAHKRIVELREAILMRPAPVPNDLVQCVTPDGTRLVLVRTDGDRHEPVKVGAEVQEDHCEGDGPYAAFIVTGAAWRDDIDEGPIMMGRWASYATGEVYPMSTNGFQVAWEAAR
jgi:hypothetical protein